MPLLHLIRRQFFTFLIYSLLRHLTEHACMKYKHKQSFDASALPYTVNNITAMELFLYKNKNPESISEPRSGKPDEQF